MSREPDLDLDRILEEYHREQTSPAPPRETRPSRPRPEQGILQSGQRAEEETVFYEGRPARHGAPAPLPEKEPAPERGAEERAEPSPRRESEEAPPRKRERRAEQTPAPKRRPPRGLGFALMFAVLLILAAALAGLLRWTRLTQEAELPPEPAPLRLQLGEELERALNESAESSR